MQQPWTSALSEFSFLVHFIYSATNLHDDTYFFMRVWHSGLNSLRISFTFLPSCAFRASICVFLAICALISWIVCSAASRLPLLIPSFIWLLSHFLGSACGAVVRVKRDTGGRLQEKKMICEGPGGRL
ncbi:hypothetical protein B0T16DRAFT_100753 [Cercophora newfieldiana]|uniref:Transmembrane protein n=1 Tax=Cercophora newfieldiana TaxID=92897 RepID=A0AA39YHC4_9PEZI|nr:hypothetical protein B0T16DRAFT_100753 [Cercophora newfieldiana]